jgi:hypothetical protein
MVNGLRLLEKQILSQEDKLKLPEMR